MRLSHDTFETLSMQQLVCNVVQYGVHARGWSPRPLRWKRLEGREEEQQPGGGRGPFGVSQ